MNMMGCLDKIRESGRHSTHLRPARWYPLVDGFAVEIPLEDHSLSLGDVDGEVTVEEDMRP